MLRAKASPRSNRFDSCDRARQAFPSPASGVGDCKWRGYLSFAPNPVGRKVTMKLYMHPVSMTSRPVRLFIAENNIDVDEQVVDLMTGEHMREPYASINPNAMVPMLEDGDFRLTESSAILKYLADRIGSPAYPKDLKQRAKVNEVMDWINTNFYRDYAYGLCYPQL